MSPVTTTIAASRCGSVSGPMKNIHGEVLRWIDTTTAGGSLALAK
jgi:hypothetical protein